MDKKINHHQTLLHILIFIALFFTAIPQMPGKAQTPVPDWSDPANVSRTGGTADPVFVIDAFDNVHVFWNDTFADQGYARWDGQQWSESTSATFNFGLMKPLILADQNGFLHSFWINEAGVLVYSRVLALEAGNAVAWTSPLALATSVLGFHAAVGNEGRLYLAYVVGISLEGTLTGVYVRRSESGGSGWGAGTPLYLTEYFRGLARDDIRINVTIAKGRSPDAIFVVWDDQPLRRVHLAKSLDDGSEWSEPLEIDGPKAGEIPPEPFNIQTFAYDENVLVLWQSRLQSGFDCTQNYQFSSDLGENWQIPAVLYKNLAGCPQANQIVMGTDGLVFLLSKIQNSAYLSAWDGESWSSPKLQGFLSGFSDPAAFNLVKLDCIQAAVNSQGVLYVAGCDVTGNGDAWVASTTLGTHSDWYQSSTSWISPQVALETETEISYLTMIADASGLFHAFWVENAEPTARNPRDKLFYSQLEGETWSEPVEIIRSPDNKIGGLSVIEGADGNLYLIWTGNSAGEVFFSWANAPRAVSPFEWNDPVALSLGSLVSDPTLSAGAAGALLITFARPYNEQRGIYYIESNDQGNTWSEVKTIFDAAKNGWEVVGNPHLVQTNAGFLHATWTLNSPYESGVALKLYYSASNDGGKSWSNPQEVINTPIKSSWLESYGSLTIHRIWEGSDPESSGIWHEVSFDNGITWTRSVPITILGLTGPANVTMDPAGHIHVFQSLLSEQSQLYVEHWWWDGEQWITGEPIEYGQKNELNIYELSPAVNIEGNLVVIADVDEISFETGLPVNQIVYTSRSLGEVTFPIPEPTLTGPAEGTTPAPQTTETPLPEEESPILTPPPGIPDFGSDFAVDSAGNSTLVLLIGGIASVFVVLAGILVFYRKGK